MGQLLIPDHNKVDQLVKQEVEEQEKGKEGEKVKGEVEEKIKGRTPWMIHEDDSESARTS